MNKVLYYVEGECEEKLINALKEAPAALCPGKVKRVNVIQNVLSISQLIQIQSGTIVVLVFDTDVPQTECLKKNIRLLEEKCTKVKTVCLAQVLNLEDELVRCTDVAHVEDLTRSKSRKDFKRDFCATKNTRKLFEQHHIDVAGLWTTTPPEEFLFIDSISKTIKL